MFDGELEVTIPESYEPFDPRVLDPNEYEPENEPLEDPSIWFVSRGGKAALTRALPDSTFSESFLDEWLFFDTRAFVRIRALIALTGSKPLDRGNGTWLAVPAGASAQDVHDLFCGAFSKQWGKFAFDLFDVQTGIGRCVNVMGAFVAVFTRKIGNSLVVIEATDHVEYLLAEPKLTSERFAEMTAAEKWQFFRSAANADTAEQILLDARLSP